MPQPGLLACLLLGLLAACTSTPPAPRPQRVTYFDLRSGARFELVNETHTGRLEQYSEVRSDAARKVQTDEVMQGLVEVLRDRGFDDQARPGPAPRAGEGESVMALEIEDGDKIEHVLGYRGMPEAELRRLLELRQDFLELYNATYGLQAVEQREGESPFQNPVGPTRKKLPKVPGGQG